MSIVKKKRVRKIVRKIGDETVVIKVMDISPEETLFPEKVAHAKEVLSKAINCDPRFSAGIRKD